MNLLLHDLSPLSPYLSTDYIPMNYNMMDTGVQAPIRFFLYDMIVANQLNGSNISQDPPLYLGSVSQNGYGDPLNGLYYHYRQ